MKLNLLRALSIIAGFAISGTLSAQTFYSNGAVIQVNTGGNIFVNGGATLDNTTSLVNDGNIQTTNSGNNGDYTLNNTSVSQGNGNYKIENNWINNASFIGNQSTVELYGANQLITGTNVTTYHNLTLTGTGIKTQTLDANVDATGILNLNDRELATDAFALNVLNPATASVIKTAGNAGFVSSLGNGHLARETNQTAVYLFPTGSSLGTVRYRPIELTPAGAATNTYAARLANNDATIDAMPVANFDNTAECSLNDLYYHRIKNPVGATAADLTVYFDVADGAYTAIDQWNTPAASLWNNLGAVTSSTNFGFNGLTKITHSNFTTDDFILARNRPGAPTLSGPAAICGFASDLNFVATGSSATSVYTWTVPNGVTFNTQGDASIIAQWASITGGQVSVTEDVGGNCLSLPAVVNVNTYPQPVANFDTIVSGLSNNIFVFADSSIGATAWSWDFGDNSSLATNQNPQHLYNMPGEYTVTQIVTNAFGCSDTITEVIILKEDIDIPNVFTPNGDGTNDAFIFKSFGLKEVKVKIFDRWGLLMFETEGENIAWDGRTIAGSQCPAGTYYYLLTARSETKDYSKNGYLTLYVAK